MADEIMELLEVFTSRRKSSCVGEKVDWALRFADSYQALPGYARVLFRSRPNDTRYVAVDVPLGDYPWLASLRKGEPVQVRGCISEVGGNAVELASARLLKLTDPAP